MNFNKEELKKVVSTAVILGGLGIGIAISGLVALIFIVLAFVSLCEGAILGAILEVVGASLFGMVTWVSIVIFNYIQTKRAFYDYS